MRICSSLFLFLAAVLSTPTCAQADDADLVKLVPGDVMCAPGQRLLSVSEATDLGKSLCNRLPDSVVARLSGYGSLAGPGGNCEILRNDLRPLKHSLCMPSQDYGRIRGVLLNGGFRTQEELTLMSPKDWREALIIELANRTLDTSQDYAAWGHDDLSAAGALLVHVLRAKKIPPAQLATMRWQHIQQGLIHDLSVQTGLPQSELEARSLPALLELIERG